MSIEEYIRSRTSNLSIPISEHPMFSKFRQQPKCSRYWKLPEAILWFDRMFPLEIVESILRIIKQKESSEVDYLKLFNSFSVVRVDKQGLFTQANCFISNPLWAATPKATVTCRCCGVSTSNPIVRHQLFKKSKKHTIGVDSICKKCHSEYTQHSRGPLSSAPFKIVGPYSSLLDTKRCSVCRKVVPMRSILSSFRRTRWSVAAVDKITGLEATLPSMFSKVCLKCEQLEEYKPGPQNKQRQL